MKSRKELLINRGYLEKEGEMTFRTFPADQALQLLKSKVATERTLGARLLSKSCSLAVARELVQALKREKKLYPKIEICNALVSHGALAAALLIAELGKVGTNQHKGVPEKAFGKDNYPLPRDIAARTLAHMGNPALPELMKVLGHGEEKQISEAIDAIGFICFYDYQPYVFEILIDCYLQHNGSELLSWKIIRAMSAFPESLSFLLEQKTVSQNSWIQKEIDRSLRLIGKRGDLHPLNH